jgi:histidinol-phosphate aminotransferase
MSEHRIGVPPAKTSVASSNLWRPDWTTGVPRDAALLWLDKNENADPEIQALTFSVFRQVDSVALSTYPECTQVYRKLAAHLGIGMDRLLLTHGSDGGIRSVFEAFVGPGDVVLHTAPTFAMYPVYTQMYGARALPLEYEAGDNGPRLSAAEIIHAIRINRPRVVCLPNPDSPTGTVFAAAELRGIVEAAGDAGAVMLVDEAYHPFYPETALPWVEQYSHLVVARTFAKAWALAGLRIGYVAACPDLATLLHKVRPMYEVNTVAVAVVERMLDHVDEMMASVARLTAGRDSFLAAMAQLGLPTIPAHGNFAHVHFGRHEPAVHAALKGVVLYRRTSNERSLQGYSRFSATTVSRFEPVIERIRQVVTADAGEGAR